MAMVGNSHVLTLFEGYELIAGQLPPGWELTFIAKGQHKIGYAVGSQSGIRLRQLSGNFLDLVGEVSASDVFVMWLGSQMNVRGLLMEGPPFDVVLPSDGERIIDSAVELIPCSVVESMVRSSLDRDPVLAQVIDRVRSRGARAWLMAPPHALPRHAVRERMGNESHFATRLREIGRSATDASILPDPARVRLRTLLLCAYRDWAAAHGAGFCPPPDRVADTDGLLMSQYWGRDVTHGSAAYGAAYLHELVAVAAAQRG
jgi:hypothetical protein